MRSAILKTALSALLVVLLGSMPAQAAASKPDTFPLPNGFQPEGIAIGPGPFAYFGSRLTGDIYRADLRTGKGAVFSKGPGTPSLGLKTDGRRLFVAGGTGGNARVIDLRTGAVLRTYTLATGTSFVNDVILVGDAAYFTDSANPVLYKLELGRKGSLPAEAVKIPLSGAIQYTTGNNANGIAPSPDRRSLLVVQSNTGKLFEVDPSSGVATEVDLGGELLTNGDGLLLSGRTLYAVQNRLNTIAVIELARDGESGTIVRRLTDPRFDVPTTVAAYGHRLYLPNARFTTTPTPDTPYSVVAITS
ncbi:superoxide dismutase [Nonomuraea jiangxiensis]|uniref:Sugar lactone lactonase YvrE n=1 Tax=Nonomuraea jiangxiensis TaxID=633440 RepID=A0A1G9R8V1_9ACTN|nr:superoxide dismutase [Nonomuraea jiangxiensis]SDM19668.1 Sugar lactone lactonase YvrE [Nonomuraea jiangxiensis]